MLSLIFGSTSDKNQSSENFIDANILKGNYVVSRSYFDTDEYIEKSTLNINVIDSNTFIFGNLKYTQYEPGMFNSDVNMPVYASINPDGSVILNFFTMDIINSNLFSNMISGINFTGKPKFQDNCLKPWHMMNNKKLHNYYKNIMRKK